MILCSVASFRAGAPAVPANSVGIVTPWELGILLASCDPAAPVDPGSMFNSTYDKPKYVLSECKS